MELICLPNLDKPTRADAAAGQPGGLRIVETVFDCIDAGVPTLRLWEHVISGGAARS
jgi:hypothetical protein